MFKVGDMVRIKKEWLDPNEDPSTIYVVMEDYGDGTTKVWVKSEISAFGGHYYVWASEVFYKVGHMDIERRS